jgi:outer membrane lipoprotein-sorting protein
MTPLNASNLETRLDSLGRLFPDDPNFVERLLNRIETENIRPDRRSTFHLRRFFVSGIIGLAATVLLAVAIWSICVQTAQPAYAIDAVAQRLLSLNSLHLKGVIYVGGIAHRFELIAQQPDRCRINGRIDQSDPNNVKSTNVIITAGQRAIFDPSAKTATIIPESPEDAREEVAEILQSEVQMMFGASSNFVKTRSETVSGIPADVYETRIEPIERIEIWFNPRTGLPLQTKVYRTDGQTPPRLISTIDLIEPNPAIDPAIFNPSIPPDYKLVTPKPTPDLSPELRFGGCTLGHFHFCNRLQIALANGDVLACWCLFDDRNPGNDLNVPDAQTTMKIETLDGTSFTQHLLHADPTKTGFHWRWSLLRPATPAPGRLLLSWTIQHDHDDGRNIKVVTSYKPQDLPDRVINLQKQTLPPDGKPWTLQEIETSAPQSQKP